MNAEVFFLVPNNPLMRSSTVDVARVIAEAMEQQINSIVVHYSPNAIEVSTISNLVKKSSEQNISVAFLMPVPVWNV
jgi:hypothetical protein